MDDRDHDKAPTARSLSNDSTETILAAWRAAEKKEISRAQASEIAGSLGLARAASSENVARLIEVVATILPGVKKDALPLADLIERHASTLDTIGRSHEALMLYNAIQAAYQQYAEPEQLGQFHTNCARLLSKCGMLSEAVAGHDLALPLLKQHALPADYTRCLMDRANALTQQGKHAEAVAGYDEALSLIKQHEPPTHYASCLINRAIALTQQGKHAEAVAGYDEALSLLDQHELPTHYASCLINRAIALTLHGKHAEAVAGFDHALYLLKTHAPPVDYARCLMNRAQALWMQGKHAEAAAGYEEALPLLKQQTLPADYARCLMNRANVLRDQANHVEALADYDQALPLHKIHTPPADYARCIMNRAIALGNQGKFAEAMAGYDQALPLFEQYGPPASYAGCMINRASTLSQQGKYAEAMAAYEEGLPLIKTHGKPEAYSRSLMNRACALLLQGKNAEAVAAYDEALPLLKEHAPPVPYALCLMNRAIALTQQGKHADAMTGYEETRAVLRRARRRSRVDETSVEFTTHWAKLFRLAVASTLACDDIERAHETVCDGKAGLIGDLHYRLAEPTTNEPSPVVQAREALTDWMRNQVPSRSREATQQTEIDTKRLEEETNLFGEELTRFLDERDERTKRYLSAWSQHYHAYVPQRSDPVSEALPTRRDIQGCLPVDWVLLDFWWTENDEFLVFVVFEDDFRVEKLTFPLSKLQPKLDRLLESIRNPTETEPNLDALNDLHARLFKPLLPLLRERGIHGLYLVPHDFLHGLPLHAARNAKEQRYLCDEFAIAYLPSAALLPRLPKPDLSGGAFLLANPEAGTEYTLPFSHWEGEQLRQRLQAPAERVFLGQAATLASTKTWASAGLVHFSCHGHGDERFSPRSHLRLADDLLLAHDVLYRWPALKEGAVVILNGCQTSVPDWRAVNEGMGLMTAFLLRGAGLVLSTQWSVADGCAAEMVLEFVEKMHDGKSSPAEALTAARERVRRMSNDDILKRADEVGARFGAGSPERAKVDAHRVRVCWRAGLLMEAVGAAEAAAPALREAGLTGEADQMLRHMHQAQSVGVLPVTQRHNYDSPVYWGAFQLVGRVT